MKNKNAESIKINDTLYKLGLVLIFVLLIVFVIIKIVNINVSRFYILCLINKITGYYCPGCGGTRAILSLFRGHVIESLKYHPVVPYGIFLFSWYMITNTVEKFSKGKFQIGMNYKDLYIWIGFGIMIFNLLIKNITIFLTGTPGI